MAQLYKLETSKDNPLITLNSLRDFKNGLDAAFGGDLSNIGDRIKYYIVKDDVGYKIVGAEDAGID